jgi:hypothetical protein
MHITIINLLLFNYYYYFCYYYLLLYTTSRSGGWILSPSSCGTYSVGPIETALIKQQTPSVQNHPQTDLDLWYPTVGHGFHIQHRDPGTFSI